MTTLNDGASANLYRRPAHSFGRPFVDFLREAHRSATPYGVGSELSHFVAPRIAGDQRLFKSVNTVNRIFEAIPFLRSLLFH